MASESAEVKQAQDARLRALQRSVEQRERELLILSHVAARVHGADHVQEIYDIALEEILRNLGLEAAWIFTGSDSDRKLHLTASRGVSESWLTEVRTEGLSPCLCPEVFETGHRMQARNTLQCPRMPHIVKALDAPVAHACIPLKIGGETRGVLNVAARPHEVFSEEELRFLDTLGHQVGLAVERARHREAEGRRDQEARAMAAINKAIGGSLDAGAVLTAVGQTALELLNADRVHILLGSEPRDMMVAHVSGLDHPMLKPGQTIDLVERDVRLQRRAIEERSTFTIDDWSTDPRVNNDLAVTWGALSGMCVPLLSREGPLGLLVISSATVRHWSEEQVDVAEALANQATVALENARLYAETRRAFQELKDAQARMIQHEKMAVLGTFASGLAHEVRNPLNSMALQLSILERRIHRCDPVLGREMIDLTGIIREEIKRLDSLVSDFLLFSRTSRIQYRPAQLDALVDEVMRLLSPEALSAGVTLKRQTVGEPMPSLQMDAEKIKQVVINLVRNSIEAMPEGGVVTLSSGIRDGRAVLVVRDSGPGLPEGLDVFQLFVTTKAKGTGLGLAIVEQIVMQHGGEITAGNDGERGAVFTITLPLPAGGPRGQEDRA